MASRRRRRAIRLGIPGLIVGVLTIAALWRLGAPAPPAGGGPAPTEKPAPLAPLTEGADALATSSIGRRASLENVPIREIPSARTLWIGSDPPRVFVVLDPDVKLSPETRLAEGARVTLIGLVRASPKADVAIRQWSLDAATAQTVEAGGTYLHVTEVRPASE